MNIIVGDSQLDNDSLRKDLNYEYPGDLDLTPSSKLHKSLANKVLSRARASHDVISKRYASWNQVDEKLSAFISIDDKEALIQKKDNRKPVSIVFPYSYAILDTLLTYLVAAFHQEPIFQYEGVSGEDTIGAIMLEKIINLHCHKSKFLLNLHTHLRDGLSYGVGYGAPGWEIRKGYKTVKYENKRLFAANDFSKETVEAVLYEGNVFNNIDPYNALPDPSVPVQDIQKGEFFGWLERTNYHELLTREANGDLFNVKYLKDCKNRKTSVFGADNSRRMPGISRDEIGSNVTNHVDVLHMMVNIIPKDWKLGTKEYPEKWYFQLAGDQVIIKAQPLDLDHGMYPVTSNAPDFDGYSTSPISKLETVFGLQKTLDWMFNAHVANVRKAINDTIVYDPYAINTNDLKGDKSNGGLIRTRRPVWGKGGIRDSIMQLAVTDVTRGHVADSGFIVNWMQKITAADDSTMGSLRTGGPERLTGKEFEGTQMMSFSRLAKVAQIVGTQSLTDIGTMFASHAQQLMSEETYVNTTGRWQETLMAEYGDAKHMKVTPFDILVDYDVIVRDGSIPGTNFSGVWSKMFELLATNPELGKTFDIVRIFKHIARNSGAKNVDEFVRTQTMPDAQVADQVQQGNLVPFNGGVG